MMVWPAIQKPEILESKVKWAFGSTAVNKASGYDRTPVELFKTLKDDVIKVLHSIYVTKSGRPSSGHRIRKGQSSSQLPRRVVLKNVLAIRQLYLSPMLVRSCLKSCMLGFSIMWTKKFQISKQGLEKEEELEIKCQHLQDYRESKGISGKHLSLFHWQH